MAYPSQGSSISMSQINVELGHSATAELSLATAANEEFGRTIGQTVEICEFYTDGCPLGANEVEVTSRWLEVTGQSTPCEAPGAEVLYYVDTAGTPTIGNIWYTSSPGVIGSTELDGDAFWWYYDLTNTMHRIDNDGAIVSITTCP